MSEQHQEDRAKATVTYRDDKKRAPALREGGAAAFAPDEETHYTYADYCAWDDDQRWELIDGIPYAMSAPTLTHEDIGRGLYLQFGNFLKGKSCKVYHAPVDVRLNADTADNTVVQPDLLVVCDYAKFSDGKSCKGAPDLIIEIQSPSTAGYDRIIKLELYRKTGVREYWMVDPDTKTVQVCVLKDGQYYVTGYTGTDTAPVSVLLGLEISLSDVFSEME